MTIKTRKPGELVFSGILVLVSLFLVYQSYQISGIGELSSAGFFPLLASSVMLISSVTIFTSSYKAKEPQFPVEAFLSQVLPRNVVIMLICALLFILCMDLIGFIIAAFLFLFGSFAFFYRSRWQISLLLSVSTLVVIYLIFRVIFLVVLPENDLVSTFLAQLGV